MTVVLVAQLQDSFQITPLDEINAAVLDNLVLQTDAFIKHVGNMLTVDADKCKTTDHSTLAQSD